MLRRIISNAGAISGLFGRSFCKFSTASKTGESGVRNSCESMARKLSFVRLAASTNAFCASSAASIRRRSAMAAASAIAVRVKTAVELCKISRDWFAVSITNGPKFLSVPQMAIAERMNMPVAVSRCDMRNAIQIRIGPQTNATG